MPSIVTGFTLSMELYRLLEDMRGSKARSRFLSELIVEYAVRSGRLDPAIADVLLPLRDRSWADVVGGEVSGQVGDA